MRSAALDLDGEVRRAAIEAIARIGNPAGRGQVGKKGLTSARKVRSR